jgi:hypothetical protein
VVFEERIKMIIGNLVMESAMLMAKLEQLEKELAEIKSKDQPNNG